MVEKNFLFYRLVVLYKIFVSTCKLLPFLAMFLRLKYLPSLSYLESKIILITIVLYYSYSNKAHINNSFKVSIISGNKKYFMN